MSTTTVYPTNRTLMCSCKFTDHSTHYRIFLLAIRVKNYKYAHFPQQCAFDGQKNVTLHSKRFINDCPVMPDLRSHYGKTAVWIDWVYLSGFPVFSDSKIQGGFQHFRGPVSTSRQFCIVLRTRH